MQYLPFCKVCCVFSSIPAADWFFHRPCHIIQFTIRPWPRHFRISLIDYCSTFEYQEERLLEREADSKNKNVGNKLISLYVTKTRASSDASLVMWKEGHRRKEGTQNFIVAQLQRVRTGIYSGATIIFALTVAL